MPKKPKSYRRLKQIEYANRKLMPYEKEKLPGIYGGL